MRVDERSRRREGGADAAHVGEEVERVLVAQRGIPSRGRHDEGVDLRRDAGAHGRRRRDVGVHVLVRDAERALAGVRDLAGDHLEQQDPGRVDIGPAVRIAPLDLLGGQVRDGADDHPLRHALAVGLDRAGQSEVRHLDPAVVGDQDVLGLDVPVHEAGGVGGGEGLEHGVEEHERLLGRERAVLPQDVAQRPARDVLHREVDQAVVLALVVHRDDMAVGEPGGGARLALEARDEGLVVRQVRVHDLEGDDAVQAQVEGLVDGRHAAAGEQGDDAVPAVDGPADEPVLPRRLHPCESR